MVAALHPEHWIALAGIISGGLVALFSPLVAATAQRRVAADTLVAEQRAEAYVALLKYVQWTGRFVISQMWHSPDDTLQPELEPGPGPDADEREVLLARVTAFGSHEIRTLLAGLMAKMRSLGNANRRRQRQGPTGLRRRASQAGPRRD